MSYWVYLASITSLGYWDSSTVTVRMGSDFISGAALKIIQLERLSPGCALWDNLGAVFFRRLYFFILLKVQPIFSYSNKYLL